MVQIFKSWEVKVSVVVISFPLGLPTPGNGGKLLLHSGFAIGPQSVSGSIEIQSSSSWKDSGDIMFETGSVISGSSGRIQINSGSSIHDRSGAVSISAGTGLFGSDVYVEAGKSNQRLMMGGQLYLSGGHGSQGGSVTIEAGESSGQINSGALFKIRENGKYNRTILAHIRSEDFSLFWWFHFAETIPKSTPIKGGSSGESENC